MNEIEENLLMIFLVDNSALMENAFELYCKGESFFQSYWENFKQEELGRTLPETYEFLATDTQLERIRKGEPFTIGLSIHKEFAKNKIKITVVNE